MTDNTADSTLAPAHRIGPREMWGGNKEINREVRTPTISASIRSTVSGDSRGGDVYYLSLCSADRMTRVPLADVRGHGHHVAHLSQWLFDLLEESIDHLDGSSVLAGLNQRACDHGFDALTTAAIVTYHSSDASLHYSCAGHPPIFVRKAGGAWSPKLIGNDTSPANLPLGAVRDIRYDTQRLEFNVGDRVFLYTDGVVECASPAGEFFGEERLLGVLQETADLTLKQVKALVFESLREFAGGDLLQDDCTLMVIEVTHAD